MGSLNTINSHAPMNGKVKKYHKLLHLVIMVKLNLGEKINQNQRLNDTEVIFGKKLT